MNGLAGNRFLFNGNCQVETEFQKELVEDVLLGTTSNDML